MKVFAWFGTTALCFALVSMVPVFAQEEHHDEAAPAAHQDQAKPEHQEAAPAHQEEGKPARQEEAKPERREDNKAVRQDDKAVHQQDQNSRQDARPEDRDAHRNDARPAQNSERMEQAHNGGGGRGHIPDDRFRANFGRPHTFRVGHPTVVEGRPRFQYSGYWFEFADPWPAGWSYDDDCYIDYVDDGYYLFDPRYPGMRIAVIVIS
jgi:hypothetical protein